MVDQLIWGGIEVVLDEWNLLKCREPCVDKLMNWNLKVCYYVQLPKTYWNASAEMLFMNDSSGTGLWKRGVGMIAGQLILLSVSVLHKRFICWRNGKGKLLTRPRHKLGLSSRMRTWWWQPWNARGSQPSPLHLPLSSCKVFLTVLTVFWRI